MLKKSKQNTITNENISPFNDVKVKHPENLFKVLHIRNTNDEGHTNRLPLPHSIKMENAQVKPKALYQDETLQMKTPNTVGEENILDFDKLLEVLCPRTIQSTLGILNVKRTKKTKKLLERKTVKSSKTEISKKTKNKPKRKTNHSNNIYNINNFFSNISKIVEKKDFINVECPSFKENSIFYDNNQIEQDEIESEIEDLSDQHYKKYHDEFEQREHNFSIKFFEDYKKKDSKKAIKNANKSILT